MIRMLKKKEKAGYSLLSNIKYIYSILFQNYPVMRLYFIITIILNVSLPLLGNLIPAAAVDSIIHNNSALEFIAKMILILVIYGILTFLQNFIEMWSEFYIDHTQNKSFLLKLLLKSLKTDYVNVESQKQQRYINKASHAVNVYRKGVNLMYFSTPKLISNALGLIIYATTITIIDIRIIFVIFIMVLLGIWMEHRARKIELSYKEEQFCIWGRFYYLKKQGMSLESGKDIRIFGMRNWFFDAFMKLVTRNKKLAIAKNKGWFRVSTTDSIMRLVRDLISYAILVQQVLNGRLILSEFIFCLGIVSGISNWSQSLRQCWSDLMNGTIMLRDYRIMIDYPDHFLREEGISIPDKSKWPPKIEFCHVSFQYEEAEEMTLKDINLTIHPNENIALVGHNGAGKTTFVKLLCGLYQPTSGKILIDGHSIDEYNLEEYHTLLSTIFQEPYTLPLSIASNVSCVNEELTDYNKVRDCLDKSGLLQDVDKMKEKEMTYITQTFCDEGVELSGGMLQKLMLARAMYKDAPILILDEPTAALDPIAESAMYEEYEKISKNKSSIFISHRLASTKFCDRIIYLEGGQIIESGTHEELMNTNGRYANIFQVQSQYYKNEEDIYENSLYSGC